MSLKKAASEVRHNAYAPYSNFKVGAALRGKGGVIYMGVNVENVAYPEGTCAEAGAISAMVAGGESEIVEICVVASGGVPVSPCGGCRQKISEFSKPDAVVLLSNPDGVTVRKTAGGLLPGSFHSSQLKE